MTSYQRRILRYLKKHSPCSEKRLKIRFGVLATAALKKLEDKELVEREGRVLSGGGLTVIGFSGDYSITEDGKLALHERRLKLTQDKLTSLFRNALSFILGVVSTVIASIIIQALSK